MKIIKRIFFVIAIIPVWFLSLFIWIFTGKEPVETIDDFIGWCQCEDIL